MSRRPQFGVPRTAPWSDEPQARRLQDAAQVLDGMRSRTPAAQVGKSTEWFALLEASVALKAQAATLRAAERTRQAARSPA